MSFAIFYIYAEKFLDVTWKCDGGTSIFQNNSGGYMSKIFENHCGPLKILAYKSRLEKVNFADLMCE